MSKVALQADLCYNCSAIKYVAQAMLATPLSVTTRKERSYRMDSIPQKRCSRCKEIKSFEEFGKRGPKRGNAYESECRACKRKRNSQIYHSSPKEQARVKNKRLKKSFGITLEEYQVLSDAQRGLCAICGKEETSFDTRHKVVRSLAVDHNHATGEVRGLLCFTCNMALGYLHEDVTRIQALLTYVLKYQIGG